MSRSLLANNNSCGDGDSGSYGPSIHPSIQPTIHPSILKFIAHRHWEDKWRHFGLYFRLAGLSVSLSVVKLFDEPFNVWTFSWELITLVAHHQHQHLNGVVGVAFCWFKSQLWEIFPLVWFECRHTPPSCTSLVELNKLCIYLTDMPNESLWPHIGGGHRLTLEESIFRVSRDRIFWPRFTVQGRSRVWLILACVWVDVLRGQFI